MTLDDAKAYLRFSVRVIRVIREQQKHGPLPISESWRTPAAARIRECRAVIAAHKAASQLADRRAA